MIESPLPHELAVRIEQAEVSAWQDFYAAAPAPLRQGLGLGIAEKGSTVLTACAPIPFIMFNRVINLGIPEPASEAALDAAVQHYQDAGIQNYCIHHMPISQPEGLEDWLYARGLAPNGGWERIWRDHAAPSFEADPQVEQIDAGTAGEWADFLFGLYKIPIQPWLLALVGRPRWFHYALRKEGRIVAARSQYVDPSGTAWMGIEAPVPGAMAPSFDDDRRICQTMVVEGLRHGIRVFGADIEVPSADRKGPAYDAFESLGFQLAYLRRHFRPAS